MGAPAKPGVDPRIKGRYMLAQAKCKERLATIGYQSEGCHAEGTENVPHAFGAVAGGQEAEVNGDSRVPRKASFSFTGDIDASDLVPQVLPRLRL